MLKNPLVHALAAAGAAYLYQIYQRSQLPEDEREDVSIVTPLIVGAVVGAASYAYFQQGNGGLFGGEQDSSIESDLVSAVEQVSFDGNPAVARSGGMDVYTALWED
jgi:Na+/H+-translocating membrane pyrophosphatase